MNDNVKLVNAIEMNWMLPDSFHLPSEEKLKNLDKGTSVQICLEEIPTGIRERVWTTIDEFDGYYIDARFSFERTDIKSIKKGKKIRFTIENIYQVYDDDYVANLYVHGDITMDQSVELLKKFYPNVDDDELKRALENMKNEEKNYEGSIHLPSFKRIYQ